MENIIINYTGKFGSVMTQGFRLDTKELYMRSMGITSIDLTPIAESVTIKRINLSHNKLEEIDLTPLSLCYTLNFISLSHNEIKQIDISPLFFCPNLGNVELDQGIIPIADARLKPLLPRRAGLKYLEIRMARRIQWKEEILSPELVSKLESILNPQLIKDESKSPITETPIESSFTKDELQPSLTTDLSLDVKILRGGEIVGGKFEYKVKISNETSYVINNVTVTVVAYPQDCMDVSGSMMKTISRIEPAGFRSPQFTFAPTKDCVEGKLLATVSYVDHENNLQMKSVEPYIIRSVCDLLKPLDKTPEVFEKLIIDMDSTSEKMSLDWNPQVIFTKARKLLPIKNFHVIDSDERTIGGHFTGTIRGFAEGKYTGKKVAVQALISGPIEGNQAEVVIEGMGEDIAMLPTTIEEISVGIGSWICMNCGAAIDVDGVTKIKQKVPISCSYCRQTLTIDLYRK
ncbi:hypothetical protein E4H12_09185 [Candidatus Thorarchaeota archaeon]|nr:MAG: hypothetical protein E4H12_09185 [Candidatus Thorarchaeota archaeon]